MSPLASVRRAAGLAAAGMLAMGPVGVPPAAAGEITAELAARVALGSRVDALVVLAEQADLSAAGELHGRAAKSAYVVEQLRTVATRTQAPLLETLAREGLVARSYWVANMVAVEGVDGAQLTRLASRPEVREIVGNEWFRVALPPTERSFDKGGGIEPSLLHVGVLELWNAGYTGQGVVVGGQDTGYDWDHPALVDQYRGWNGASASHDHHWWDAIHSTIDPGTNPCGLSTAAPCDDNSHGTHTMGTMVGDDGGANRIGMAPGARWIGCRNMDRGAGRPSTYAECFQFFLAPTDLAGGDPQPALSPDVINNSWSCPPEELCAPTTLQTVVENVRAAGIVVVAAAGNEGSGCSTIANPPAIYDATFTVARTGATNDAIASSSSRGPVTSDGSGRMKPDVAAPGSSIRSAVPGGGYGVKSGTSMASPHVAGLVALLLSARPELSGEVDAIEAWIRAHAVPTSASGSCGGVDASETPNPFGGWGAVRAVDPHLFADGFESGTTASWSSHVP